MAKADGDFSKHTLFDYIVPPFLRSLAYGSLLSSVLDASSKPYSFLKCFKRPFWRKRGGHYIRLPQNAIKICLEGFFQSMVCNSISEEAILASRSPLPPAVNGRVKTWEKGPHAEIKGEREREREGRRQRPNGVRRLWQNCGFLCCPTKNYGLKPYWCARFWKHRQKINQWGKKFALRDRSADDFCTVWYWGEGGGGSEVEAGGPPNLWHIPF